MNNVNQPNYKPTSKLMCDVTNKTKHVTHYRVFKFHINMGMKKKQKDVHYINSSKVHG